MTLELEDQLHDAMERQVADIAIDGSIVDRAVRHRRRRQRAARTVAAGTTVVVVAAGGFAFQSGMGNSGGTRTVLSATAAPSPTASPMRDLDAFNVALVDNYLPDTGANYTAGLAAAGELSAVTDEAIASCREQAGLSHQVGTISEYVDRTQDPTQYPDLAWIAKHGTFTNLGNATSTKLSEPPTQCLQLPGGPLFPSEEQWSGLGANWFRMVGHAQSSPVVRNSLQSFRACVIAAGAVPRDATSFTGSEAPDAEGASASAFNDFIGFAAGPADEANTRAKQTASEKQWTPVFLRCARPTIELQEAAQQVARAAFLVAHADQIAALVNLTDTELVAAEATYGTPRP